MYRFEIEVSTTHILVFITIVAVLYTVWSMYLLIRDSRRMNGKGRGDREIASSSDNKVRKVDIMGKSKFVLEERGTSPSVAAVPESTTNHPRQIAPDELDNVFGMPPEGERNEPLAIYHPLYIEQSLPKVETHGGYDDGDENDENDDLPIRGRYPAHGVKFEELGDAYNRVAHNPSLAAKQEVETGRILLDLRLTDMFEYIISGSRERENKAIYLMETYLEAFRKRMEAEEAKSLPPQDVIAPQGYSVSNNARPIRRPQ